MEIDDVEESLTMEEILKTIRIVVSEGMEEKEKEEEILELTDVVELGDKAKSNNKSSNITALNNTKDVFDKIDQVIGKTPNESSQSNNAKEKNEKKSEKEENITENSVSKAEKILQDDEALNEKINPEEISTLKSPNMTNSISEKVLEAATSSLKALINEDQNTENDNILIDKGLKSLTSQLLDPYISKWAENNLSDLVQNSSDIKSYIFKWLDNHLPSLVQKIVEREIKKITDKSTKN